MSSGTITPTMIQPAWERSAGEGVRRKCSTAMARPAHRHVVVNAQKAG